MSPDVNITNTLFIRFQNVVSSFTEPNFTEVYKKLSAGIEGATCMKDEMIIAKEFLEQARAMTMKCSKQKPKNKIRPCYLEVISDMRNKSSDLNKQTKRNGCKNQSFASLRKDISDWLNLSDKDVIMALINFASIDSEKRVNYGRNRDLEEYDVNILIKVLAPTKKVFEQERRKMIKLLLKLQSMSSFKKLYEDVSNSVDKVNGCRKNDLIATCQVLHDVHDQYVRCPQQEKVEKCYGSLVFKVRSRLAEVVRIVEKGSKCSRKTIEPIATF